MSWNWWVLFRYLSHRGHEMSSTNQGQRYWFHMQRVILMNAYIYFCRSLWYKVSWLNSDITSAKCKVVWFETASIYFLRLSNKTWDVMDTFNSSDASMTYLYNIPSLHKYKCFSSVCTDLNSHSHLLQRLVHLYYYNIAFAFIQCVQTLIPQSPAVEMGSFILV